MSIAILNPLLSELDDVAVASKMLTAINSYSGRTDTCIPPVEKVNKALENAAVTSRNTLERLWRDTGAPKQNGAILPFINIGGTIRVMEYNWLHIKLNALLPHCRFQTPQYLSDTIKRLLDTHAAAGGTIPYHVNALLVIDEHCDIQNRNAFDQDNKGWKAVSNVMKGRVFPDDDQFSLGIALVSTLSKEMVCHIFVIGMRNAGEFFNMRADGSLYW